MIAGIEGPAQQGECVLDVRRFDKFEAAVFDERNLVPGQFDFESVAVVAIAKQHRLTAQRHALLTPLEDAPDQVGRLGRIIGHRDQPRCWPAAGAGGAERLVERPAGVRDQRVGGIEYRLCGAIVAMQADMRGRRRELASKPIDVFDIGAPKRINGLRIIAHHEQAMATGTQAGQQLDLQAVAVLVFVHQHVIKTGPRALRESGILHRMTPPEQ